MGDTDKNRELLTSSMSLGDHLEELRARLILALLGLTVGAVVSLVFGTHIIRFIEGPYLREMERRNANGNSVGASAAAEPNSVALVNLLFTNMVTRLASDPNAPDIDPNRVEFVRQVAVDTLREWMPPAETEASGGHRALPRSDRLVTLGPAEAFVAYMKISLIAGLLLTAPWVFYHIWMFIAAGLYEHEKKYVRTAVPFSAALFIAGALFFLFVVAPISLRFFLGFGDLIDVASSWTLQKYVSFVTVLMLVFGLGFQTPIAIFILNRTGLVALDSLRKARKYVLLVVFVIAAVVTPPDVISQITLAIPLYALYEVGMLLAHLAGKRAEKKRLASS